MTKALVVVGEASLAVRFAHVQRRKIRRHAAEATYAFLNFSKEVWEFTNLPISEAGEYDPTGKPGLEWLGYEYLGQYLEDDHEHLPLGRTMGYLAHNVWEFLVIARHKWTDDHYINRLAQIGPRKLATLVPHVRDGEASDSQIEDMLTAAETNSNRELRSWIEEDQGRPALPLCIFSKSGKLKDLIAAAMEKQSEDGTYRLTIWKES